MSGRLDGKGALVTGGGNGIGRATVLRFLAEGAQVLFTDMNPASADETIALAEAAGHRGRVHVVLGDASDETHVADAVGRATVVLGRVDCLFANAGIPGAFGPITDVPVEDWDRTFAVLVRGVFLVMKHGTRALRAQGQGGSIVATASVAGLSGGDGPQAYSASKAAVINLVRAVAVETARDRIRVNCVCPGGINTPLLHRGSEAMMGEMLDRLQPWPQHGRPEDIAAAVLYLASDDARFVTGAALVVDGGLTAQGGRAILALGGGEGALDFAGMDSGSTGVPPVMRTS
jgi:NAD(P)-dependent dehydrogenase (short-subunit alcohol dehydrogenase family)